MQDARQHFPGGFRQSRYCAELSGKMLVLDRLLRFLRTETTDRVVLVSNYTAMLDYFELFLRSVRFAYCVSVCPGALSCPALLSRLWCVLGRSVSTAACLSSGDSES